MDNLIRRIYFFYRVRYISVILGDLYAIYHTLIKRSSPFLRRCYINWSYWIERCKRSRSSRYLLQWFTSFRMFTTLIITSMVWYGARIIASGAIVLICAVDATICWMTTVHASIAATLLLCSLATYCCCPLIFFRHNYVFFLSLK